MIKAFKVSGTVVVVTMQGITGKGMMNLRYAMPFSTDMFDRSSIMLSIQ